MSISKQHTRIYPTVDSIKRANKQSDQPHWFSPDSMRFFRTRVLSGVIGGRYFITSEAFQPYDGPQEPRRYTVRIADDAGRIDTVGEFQEWSTARQARAAALAAASFGRTS